MRDTVFLPATLIVLLSLVGCGGDDTAPPTDSGAPPVDMGASDTGAPVDGGALVDAGAGDDLGIDVDSGTTDDAGVASDLGVDVDGGSAMMCASGSAIPDRVAGSCDGRGRAICTMWATTTGGANAIAQCVPATGICARADACGASGCTCGADPECADDEMCVLESVGGAYKCVCITP